MPRRTKRDTSTISIGHARNTSFRITAIIREQCFIKNNWEVILSTRFRRSLSRKRMFNKVLEIRWNTARTLLINRNLWESRLIRGRCRRWLLRTRCRSIQAHLIWAIILNGRALSTTRTCSCKSIMIAMLPPISLCGISKNLPMKAIKCICSSL